MYLVLIVILDNQHIKQTLMYQIVFSWKYCAAFYNFNKTKIIRQQKQQQDPKNDNNNKNNNYKYWTASDYTSFSHWKVAKYHWTCRSWTLKSYDCRMKEDEYKDNTKHANHLNISSSFCYQNSESWCKEPYNMHKVITKMNQNTSTLYLNCLLSHYKYTLNLLNNQPVSWGDKVPPVIITRKEDTYVISKLIKKIDLSYQLPRKKK